MTVVHYHPGDNTRETVQKVLAGMTVIAHGQYACQNLHHVLSRMRNGESFRLVQKQVRPWTWIVIALEAQSPVMTRPRAV